MRKNNVYYGHQPDQVIIYRHVDMAMVEFPINVTEEETEVGNQWKAETVYSLKTFASEGLRERIEANYEAWLNKAMTEELPEGLTIEKISERVDELSEKVDGELSEATDVISIITGGEE